MGYPTGVAASVNPGQLIINFTGVYSATSSDFGAGASDIFIRCDILNASYSVVASGVLSRQAGGLVLMADYPGGSELWTFRMSYLSHTIKGAGTVSVASLRIHVRLHKR